jgi:hypothetical protein
VKNSNCFLVFIYRLKEKNNRNIIKVNQKKNEGKQKENIAVCFNTALNTAVICLS